MGEDLHKIRTGKLHLCNAWLPSQVVQELGTESERFHTLVGLVQETLQSSTLSSRLASLKWISLVNMFLKAKTCLEIADVENLANASLRILLESSESLYIQTRWANCLSRVLSKYRKELQLQVEWRPLYTLFLSVHFERRSSYEGLSLKYSHLQNLVYLIENCRQFFKAGSCAEIWSEFRPRLEDLSHNSALEAAGFISLFLSPKTEKTAVTGRSFFTREWLAEFLEIWSAIPTCHYWNLQWASILSRCIKYQVLDVSDWEPFLSILFSKFLNAFEVPVGKSGIRSPIYWRVPAEVKRAFQPSWSPGLSTLTAKSIVYLLKPSGSVFEQFDTMVDLLEQYYHPSNGGTWTGSLQRFLRFLVFYFMKRLQRQAREMESSDRCSMDTQFYLGPAQCQSFVSSVMKLVDRGQYSKNGALSSTAASAASILSYVEPSIVLPVVVSRFQTALETVTATHQLESALKMLALSARPILLFECSSPHPSHLSLRTSLADAMFSTLSKLDANDPPKTLATMQLYCCALSSVGRIDSEDASMQLLPMDWSLWVDEFLDRLFTLLVNLEPNVQSSDDVSSNDGFLAEKGSPYSCLLELLFGKLKESQYKQALRRTAKFVTGNILPGVMEEVGLLCCNVVSVNPEESSCQLLLPIMNSLISSLLGSPKTGFGGDLEQLAPSIDFKVGLSPALELTTRYYLGVLSKSIFYGGVALPAYQSLLQQVISASFDAPSSKVNDAGCQLLNAAVGSMTFYYPISVSRFSLMHMSIHGYEEWVSSKHEGNADQHCTATWWHIPDDREIMVVNQIVDDHLRTPLAKLKKICGEGVKLIDSGQEKELLRVLLLRVEGVLWGLGTCLPDFGSFNSCSSQNGRQFLTIAGSAGQMIASARLREEVAETIHQVCEYTLENRGDNYLLLKILGSIMDMVGNYGSIEYHSYLHMKGVWDESARLLTEPCTNFITNLFCEEKRRPVWLAVERAYVHNLWRASQVGYRRYQGNGLDLPVPLHVLVLLKDFLKLSLHSYSGVRTDAARSLKDLLQRYPSLVQDCMPLLTAALQDPKATKESALGSCDILMSRPVMRHLRQDWSALTSFLLALLGSAHHESVEAQDAINELFIVFNTSFGGVPSRAYINQEDAKSMDGTITYSSMVSHVRNLLSGDTTMIHWRYNLMAHGILLFLVLPVSDPERPSEVEIVDNLRAAVAGGFLNNLKSELPPLRPLSVAALLFLLEATPHKELHNGETEKDFLKEDGFLESNYSFSENSMKNVLHDESFGENVVNKLAIDRQSGDEDGYMPQHTSDVGFAALMPFYMREWPHTRSWESDMQGDQFSPTFAKLFKRLVQKFGDIVLKILQDPLKEVVNAAEDKGKQCIAAEIMAGILHSDAECVVMAWDGWIQPLLRRYLLVPTLDSSISDWAACIRFAVGGKGRNGSRAPILRQRVLQCIAESFPKKCSTTLIARRFTLLRAALLELLPFYSSMEEIIFQSDLLEKSLEHLSHPAPQVRRSLGTLLCLLFSNIHLFVNKQGCKDAHVEQVLEHANSLLVSSASVATKTIISADHITSLSAKEQNITSKANKESVKVMEMILYFLVATIRSGRAHILMDCVIKLIYSALSLQETSEKELSTLARSVMRFLQWQPFSLQHLPHVVNVALGAANDNNWHTRVAFLVFLQPFVYRHKFILSHEMMKSLWDKVVDLIFDPQLEVRESAATTISGMMKETETTFAEPFRLKVKDQAVQFRKSKKNKKSISGSAQSISFVHGIALSLSSVIYSIPYDMPSWLPEMVTLLSEFSSEPWPVRGTVTKTIGDFRHTHLDMWDFQKSAFSEQQLEVLSNLTSSATYFV